MPQLPVVQRTPTISPTPLAVGGLELSGQLAQQGVRAAGGAVAGVIDFASQVATEQQSSHDAIQLSAFRFDMQDAYGAVLAKAKQGRVSHPDWLSQVDAGLLEAHEALMTGGLLDGVSPLEQQKAGLFSMQQISDRKGEAASFQMAQTRAMSDLTIDTGLQKINAALLLDPSADALDGAINNYNVLLGEHSQNRDMDDLAARLMGGIGTLIDTAVRTNLAHDNFDAAFEILHDPDNAQFLKPGEQNILFKMEAEVFAGNREEDRKAAEDETWRGGVRGIKSLEITTVEQVLDLGMSPSNTKSLLAVLKGEEAIHNDPLVLLEYEQLEHEGDLAGARDLARRAMTSGLVTSGWADAKLSALNNLQRGTTAQKGEEQAYTDWDRANRQLTDPEFFQSGLMSPVDLAIRHSAEVSHARVFREQNPNATAKEIRAEQDRRALEFKRDVRTLNVQGLNQLTAGAPEPAPQTAEEVMVGAMRRLQAVGFDEDRLSATDRLILGINKAKAGVAASEESLRNSP